MPIAVIALLALIGWAWWTNRLSGGQIPAILLTTAGAALIARGQVPLGLCGIAVGVFWYFGSRRRLNKGSDKDMSRKIAEARLLLGVSAHDDADAIRSRHRELMRQNHPDNGGSKSHAQSLNAARDLLLSELNKNE